jgi:hypothetical protein
VSSLKAAIKSCTVFTSLPSNMIGATSGWLRAYELDLLEKLRIEAFAIEEALRCLLAIGFVGYDLG